MGVTIGIGTAKGAWFARSEDRRRWTVSGPHLKGWEVSTFGRAPNGDHLLATASTWYGAAIHRSRDLKEWSQLVEGPAYTSEDRKLERIWTLHSAGAALYAGVAEAGLFRSGDNGDSWTPVISLNEHPTRSGWTPGLGGLALHRIISDPADPTTMWTAISAVGVFRTEDGGTTWTPANRGVDVAAADDDRPEIGFCVHRIAADPENPWRLWRQDHRGVYRSVDGGDSWERIEEGLPAGFGFPIVRDRATGSLFVIPLESDEYRMPVDGRLRVYRSTDDGDSWSASGSGLPDDPQYTGVLRDAMDVDGLDVGGVYFGTTGGAVWASPDTGDTWHQIPGSYPRISSVQVLEAS